MTTVIIIGNLTKDAEVKETKEGRKYVLLQLAENIRKRDDKGEFIKDDNGHYENAATYYHSIFVNRGEAVLQAMDLKTGEPIKVIGTAKFKVIQDDNEYEHYILDRVVGNYIDKNPFAKSESSVDESIPFDETNSGDEA